MSNKDPDDAEFTDAKADKPLGLTARLKRRVEKLAPRSNDLEIADNARALFSRASRRTRALVDKIPFQEALDAAMLLATNPTAVRALQSGMTSVGNKGFEAAFKREPDARLLFEFAEWCGEQCGRETVMALLMQDALAEYGAFNKLAGPLMSIGVQGNPYAAFAAMPRTPGMSGTLRDAHHGLMRTLTALAVAATDGPAPHPTASPEDLEAHLRALPLPERFVGLIDRAMGVTPEPEPSPEVAVEPREPDSVTETALARAKEMLPVLGLAPGHRFVLGPYLIFLQIYLTRNMVDALPGVMAKMREEVEEKDAPPPDDYWSDILKA